MSRRSVPYIAMDSNFRDCVAIPKSTITPVMPAKAGIQNILNPAKAGLDSVFPNQARDRLRSACTE
ncbi:MAG TPA: hypothetical protein PK874_14790 [Desulfobacteraceae bacterium]|nr:hypothetical protein [Desulfobacteraceae bacterium]HPJ68506.1 hypothetical protein [Desulfobacteraceae bacterium]HPQ27264.1 hypothetical protein [Desulfobacteraceae bacterium]